MRFSKLRLFLFLTTIIISTLFINCSKEDSPTEPNNNAPVATINTPLDNAIYFKSDTILFTATATDVEDGALTDSSLVWSSHINGQIGIGDSLLYSSLYENTHQIFLTATDSKGDTDIDTITVTIQANLPIVTIMSPADSSTFSFGDTITFIGTAIDREDGVLTGGSLVWTSDKDGQIGTGTSFTTNTLSNGSHVITLTAIDSQNNISNKMISLTVQANIPIVQIATPRDNSIFSFGETVAFLGVANDKEDGSLEGNSLVWTSDKDGQFGTGFNFITTNLSNNHHIITLTATDSDNNIGSISIELSVVVTFEKTFGGSDNEDGFSVKQTTDGGYIITGKTDSDIYLVKTDFTGNLVWEKTFGGQLFDEGRSVCETSDGGYILTGSIGSDLGTNNGGLYLLKTDNNGNVLWDKTFGAEYDIGYSISTTSDDGYIITGRTSLGVGGIYVLKTDINGNLLWEKTFGGIGGLSVKETTDRGYIITGVTTGNREELSLIKTDNNGNLLWEKTFERSGNQKGTSVCQTTDGGYIITGNTESNDGWDVYLIKTNNLGDIEWEKSFGGTNNDGGSSVIESPNGGFIITGYSDITGMLFTDLYLIKVDTNGNLVWEKSIGGTGWDYGLSISNTSDGGFIICGSTSSNSAGGFDVYLIKTDSEGNVY